jgi:hypothetical protein
MTNFVRIKETNVVEYVNGVGSFVDAADAGFKTIDVATTEWQLPLSGWDTSYMDCISLEIEMPEGFQPGVSKLVGSDGNYSIELS